MTNNVIYNILYISNVILVFKIELKMFLLLLHGNREGGGGGGAEYCQWKKGVVDGFF